MPINIASHTGQEAEESLPDAQPSMNICITALARKVPSMEMGGGHTDPPLPEELLATPSSNWWVLVRYALQQKARHPKLNGKQKLELIG